jgi:hypothetical protein
MTDALRPTPGAAGRLGLGLRGRRGSGPASGPTTGSGHPLGIDTPSLDLPLGRRARAVSTTRTTVTRRPYHVAAFLGASAGVYAISLAAVTGLQSAADQQTMALRAPAAAAAAQLAASNDVLDRQITRIEAELRSQGAAYGDLASTMATYGGSLDGLAAQVSELEGQAAQLPTRISLPSAPRVSSGARATTSTSRPATVATTGASGKP